MMFCIDLLKRRKGGGNLGRREGGKNPPDLQKLIRNDVTNTTLVLTEHINSNIPPIIYLINLTPVNFKLQRVVSS